MIIKRQKQIPPIRMSTLWVHYFHIDFYYEVVLKIGLLMDDKISILFNICTHFIYESMPTMTTMQIIWHNNYQSLTCALVNHILYKYSGIVGLTTQLMMPLITSTTARFSLNLNLGIFHTTKIIRLTVHFNLSTDDNISCNQGCIQQ